MKTNNNSKIWEEWMGYRVHYVFDGCTYIQDTTTYGVSYARAAQVMKQVLLQGSCAWITKMSPDDAVEVPF